MQQKTIAFEQAELSANNITTEKQVTQGNRITLSPSEKE